MYTIKELAEKTGIIPNAIRFYEKKGLLHPRRTESNYRLYEAEDVARLEQILLYRKMGFSIEDIKELLEKDSGHMERFVTQYTLLNRHIHSMERIRETLGGCIEKMLNQDEMEPLENEELLKRISETARLITLSESWKDEWNFDSQATEYDVFIREQGEGLAFYKNYDLVLEKTAEKISGDVIAEIGIGTGNLAVQIMYSGEAQSLEAAREIVKNSF